MRTAIITGIALAIGLAMVVGLGSWMGGEQTTIQGRAGGIISNQT